MTQPGTATHYFAGANTPQGFYSRYDQIAPADADKVFILKGGPGTGKSTFMKRIASDLLARGYDVEYFHCSADNEGIDAIYVPAADAAVMDGTAPHVMDPKFPGAVEDIINLGQFWNEAALRAPEVKAEIIRLTRGYKGWFQRAADARRAALAWLEEWSAYHRECLDMGRVYAAAEALVAQLLPVSAVGASVRAPGGAGTAPAPDPAETRPARAGRTRRLFASAITYAGARTFLGSLFDGLRRRIVLTGPPGTGKKTIAGRLADAAVARGVDVEVFHCTMYPDRVDHVRLTAQSTGVITSFWPHEYTPRPGDEVIDTVAFVDRGRLTAYAEAIAGAEEAYQAAVRREMYLLGRAKAWHDELERCYAPHMDFAGMESLRQETLQRILALIEERGA